YRELVRRGISDYLISPLAPLDIVRAVSGVFSAPDSEPVGRVIAVVGAKGGVGASTVGHNIAFSLARDLSLDTVIADLDLPCAPTPLVQSPGSLRHPMRGPSAASRRWRGRRAASALPRSRIILPSPSPATSRSTRSSPTLNSRSARPASISTRTRRRAWPMLF